MEWGASIAINGNQPEWLEEWEAIRFTNSEGYTGIRVVSGIAFKAQGVEVVSIRLPASHWCYSVIEKGFWPWKGGDQAPEDWTGNILDVIYRDGKIGQPRTAEKWDRWGGGDTEIIGYRRKQDKPETVSDEVPDWAMEKAAVLAGYPEKTLPDLASTTIMTFASRLQEAFARYIAAHEEPPADPVEQVCASISDLGSGDFVAHAIMRAALEKHGYRIVKKD